MPRSSSQKPVLPALEISRHTDFYCTSVSRSNLSCINKLKDQSLGLCDLTARPFSKCRHSPLVVSNPCNMKQSGMSQVGDVSTSTLGKASSASFGEWEFSAVFSEPGVGAGAVVLEFSENWVTHLGANIKI